MTRFSIVKYLPLKILSFFFIVFFSTESLKATSQFYNELDSLESILSTTNSQSKRFDLLIEILDKTSELDTVSLKKYETELLKLIKHIKSTDKLYNAYLSLGYDYSYRSNYQNAIKYYLLCLKNCQDSDIRLQYINNLLGNNYAYIGEYKIAKRHLQKSLMLSIKIKDDDALADVYSSYGVLYDELGYKRSSLKYQLKALKIYEKTKNKSGYALCIGNVGCDYYVLGDYQNALENLNKAINLLKELKDNSNLYSISIYYVNIGDVYSEMGEYRKALINYKEALKISKENKDYSTIAFSFYKIAKVFEQKKNYYQALKYYLLAKEFTNKKADVIIELEISIELAGCYTKIKKFELAQIELELAKNILSHIENDKLKIRYLRKKESQDSSFGDWKNAYFDIKEYSRLQTHLDKEENSQNMMQLAMQYNFDKKTAVIKSEQEKTEFRHKVIRNSIGLGLILALIFSVIVYRQRNKISIANKKNEELLLNILPKKVATELKNYGVAEAQYFDNVTVLFTDFKDFTKLSEKFNPKELVKEINTCFSAFDQIMHKYNIEKIKTIGDSYMAAGGLPTPNQTHAKDMVKAAIEIQKFMIEHNQSKSEKGEIHFEIRIGIHSGPVVAGIVGLKKFAYDIWSDTVNIASRMESYSEVGKINISENTYSLIKDSFNCKFRGKIEVKGKGEIEMYFVENELTL